MIISVGGDVIAITQEDVVNGKLTFPKEMTAIEADEDVFQEFGVKEIAFEEGSKLEKIGVYTFSNISTLEKIDLSNCHELKIIKKEAFSNNENLIDIIFSPKAEIEELGEEVFRQLTKLQSIDFNAFSKLKEIPSALFEYCESIEKIDLSPMTNLNKISNYAFNYLGNLKELILPESDALQSVGEYAFGSCTQLKGLDFSNRKNLKSLGNGCFWNCENLKSVNLENCEGLQDIGENFIYQSNVGNLNLKNCGVKLLGYKDHNVLTAKHVELSVDNNIVDSVTLSSRFKKGTKVNLYDKDKLIFDGTVADAPFKDINLCALRVYLTQKRRNLNWPKNFINGMNNLNEMKTCERKFNELTQTLSEITCDDDTKVLQSMRLLRMLGFFNFENCKNNTNYKQEMETYKNLLAKDLMKHKIIKEICSENNKDFINQLIQEKTNKIARSMPLEDLVLTFARNNYSDYKDFDKMLFQISKMEFDYNTNKQLAFAQFFVNNIDEMNDKIAKTIVQERVNQNYDNVDMRDGSNTVYNIYNNFHKILKLSNKKILSRSNYQRLSLEDCELDKLYTGVQDGNENLAKLCGKAHYNQKQFDRLQEIFNDGKKNIDKQVLQVCDDDSKSSITYEFIKKDNPLGLVLGSITNCCQIIGSGGESCMIHGATNPNSGFITFKDGETIIGQSWVWYDPKTKTIALDNIEVPDIYDDLVNKRKEKEVLYCVDRVCKNLFDTMTQKGYDIKNIIIGDYCTDINGLSQKYYLEEKDSNKIKNLDEDVQYTDVAREGQYVVYKDGKPFGRPKDYVIIPE